MGRPERHEPVSTPRSPPDTTQDPGYWSGGPVARLQADLVGQFARHDALSGAMPIRSPGERAVRFLSAMGGYAMLAVAYVGVVMVILR